MAVKDAYHVEQIDYKTAMDTVIESTIFTENVLAVMRLGCLKTKQTS